MVTVPMILLKLFNTTALRNLIKYNEELVLNLTV